MAKPTPNSGFVQVGENLRRYVPSGTYYARVRIGGKLHTKSLKTKSATTAKLRLAQFIKEERTKHEAKKQSGRTDDGTLTVRGAADRFTAELAHENLKPRSIDYYKEIIKAIEKTWPDLMAQDVRKVTVKQVKDWATRLRKDGTQFHIKGTKAPRQGISPTRFNASVRILRRILNVAVKDANLYANPVRDIKLARVTDKIVTLPTKEQFKILIATIENARGRFSRACADMVRFLAYSGCRIDEARRILFADIDWDRGEIAIKGDPVTATKNWERRKIPLFPPLRETLERMMKDRPDCGPQSPILIIRECQGAITRACAKIGVARITHHDLRHLFATTAIESGIDIPTVARWLGHKDGGALLMKRYSHLRADHSSEAAKKLTFE